MASLQRIQPCLWFDQRAEEAAELYVSVFPDSRIGRIARFTEAGFEHHGQPPGTVMTVEFFLQGQPFTALNGGPLFKFSEAVSFQILCDTQAEIDHYWDRLSEGGDPAAQACGWLKDRFGLSWQVVPAMLPTLIANASPETALRTNQAMFTMKKLDIARLEAAVRGE